MPHASKRWPNNCAPMDSLTRVLNVLPFSVRQPCRALSFKLALNAAGAHCKQLRTNWHGC
jgi:hypothetical protein